MGRLFWVVIVSYVLFDFSSCAPLSIDSQLKTACPNVKNLDKILPDACDVDPVPPECEIMVEYTLRLCKRGVLSFDPNVNTTWTCPLPLVAIENEKLKKDPKTVILMDRLGNKTTCLAECAGNGAKLCSRLNDFAMRITSDSQRKITKQEIPKTAPDLPHKPEAPKPPPPVGLPVSPAEKVPGESIKPDLPPALPPVKEVIPATLEPAPVPTKPTTEEEDPPPEKPEVKPAEDVDLDGDPNLAGPQRPDDYAEEDVMETESKTVKPASKVFSEFTQDSRPVHTNGPFQEAPDSHFFAYFLFLTCISVIGYIAFHNKNKLLALALEGRRGRQGRRRPNSASYRKLDSSLEEAIMSNPSRASNSPVIF